jgi:RNA recognition motif-containing protein
MVDAAMSDAEAEAPVVAVKTADMPPNHTVYAKNLNDKIKLERMKAALYAAFSQHGKVLEVVMSKARRLRGQAWVTFDDVPSASNALRALNGTVVFDKPLVLQFGKDKADVIAQREGTFVPREKRKREVKAEPATASGAASGSAAKKPSHGNGSAPPPPPPQVTVPNKILFLQDLPESCNKDMLSVLFKQYHGFKVRVAVCEMADELVRLTRRMADGWMQEVRMVPGKKGLAFVEFGDEPQAAIALQGLLGFKLTPTDTLKVSFAKK